VDNEEIERDIGISAAGLAGELGTHFVRPVVDDDGAWPLSIHPLAKPSLARLMLCFDGRMHNDTYTCACLMDDCSSPSLCCGAGFGMTLANCGQREDGVVVLELEPGFPAHRAGLLVGDIILSVGEESIVDTNVIIAKLCVPHPRFCAHPWPWSCASQCQHHKAIRVPHSSILCSLPEALRRPLHRVASLSSPLHSSDITGEVILEVAGNSPSRLVMIPNPHASKNNGELTLSDTACGVGVYVSSVTHATDPPAGCGRLEVGDTILSVDGAVTESARETMKYIARAPDPLTFVVAGRDLSAAMPAMGA